MEKCLWSIHSNQPYSQDMIRLLSLAVLSTMSAVDSKAAKKYNVCIESGKYPAAMMVKELRPHALDCHKWVYQDSPVMAISEEEAERYDAALEPMEKKHLPSQEEFYIMSRSFVEG